MSLWRFRSLMHSLWTKQSWRFNIVFFVCSSSYIVFQLMSLGEFVKKLLPVTHFWFRLALLLLLLLLLLFVPTQMLPVEIVVPLSSSDRLLFPQMTFGDPLDNVLSPMFELEGARMSSHFCSIAIKCCVAQFQLLDAVSDNLYEWWSRWLSVCDVVEIQLSFPA
jgi:hypothetical protein